VEANTRVLVQRLPQTSGDPIVLNYNPKQIHVAEDERTSDELTGIKKDDGASTPSSSDLDESKKTKYMVYKIDPNRIGAEFECKICFNLPKKASLASCCGESACLKCTLPYSKMLFRPSLKAKGRRSLPFLQSSEGRDDDPA